MYHLFFLLVQYSYSSLASYQGMNDTLTNFEVPPYIIDINNNVGIQITQCDNCLSTVYVFGGPDMKIDLIYPYQIVQCANVWELLKVCGTFLEIHKPNDKDIILERQIVDDSTIYLSTKGLKSGRYQIWITIRSRLGSVIQQVQPFYVTIVY